VPSLLRSAAQGAALFACSAACATPAYAHGFGERFVLPLPLWLWVAGAGLTIVLTFAVTAVFVRERRADTGESRLDLTRFAPFAALCRAETLAAIRAAAVAFLLLVVAAGSFGNQDPYQNILPTLVWVIWWVGFAFVCALIGDVWALVNPFATAFAWAERVFGRLGLLLPYPERLGAWPAVLVFLGFAWAELIWGSNDAPRNLATAVTAYALFTWLAMLVFGREPWLRGGEAFAVAFGVLARFAPLVAERDAQGRVRLYLRPYGAGLATAPDLRVSFLAFVLLMLATVTFDGFLETPLFQSVTNAVYSSREIANWLFRLSEIGLSDLQLIMTVALVLFPLLFLGAYWLTSWSTVALPRSGLPVARIACAFVLTLVPIAVAYHLSHYFALLLTAGQFLIPLLSDPFGWGWDLFGTRDYEVNIALVSPYVFWYGAVTIIVIGHVIAVYLAHAVALREFGARKPAMLSQVPMVLLMVAYTMTSLWILAQPVVG
jgi:hypothetical protein